MKKVVSVALFGNADAKDGSGMAYEQYLVSFVFAHANLFPKSEDWQLRLYMDTCDSRVGELAVALQEHGLLEVSSMGPAIRTQAMMWRMTPCFDESVDYVFCRDIDACPMPRDRIVCEQFIRSKCVVHTVHDSASHAGIMGGLCGFHAPAFRLATGLQSLDDLYLRAKKTDEEWAQHGTDQIVLNTLIDRADGPTLLEHRYNGWHAGPGKHASRSAGTYRCKAYSALMPDEGKSTLRPGLQAQADLLANHLGAAGYDHLAARAWWEQYGDVQISLAIRECEAA